MSRILMFGCKSPFESVSAEDTLERGLLRGNSGNLLFSHASYKTLATSNADITVSDLTDLPDRPGWVNAHFDRVVLPFANAFRPEFESRLERITDLLEQLRIPVTVLGVGAQSTIDLSLEPLSPLRPTVERFMRSVLERSPSVGVRGEFTAHYLHSLGFDDVDVIGCPSMYLHGGRLPMRTEVPGLRPDSRVVVTASREDGDWMGDLLMRTHAAHPDLTYVAQGVFDLNLMLWGEDPGSTGPDLGVPTSLSHPLHRDDQVRFFVDASTWIDHLGTVDFVFGTRIHGSVAAVLAGTPAHVMAHDSRTLELARYFEIPHTRADDVEATTSASTLFDRSDPGPMLEGHPGRFQRFVDYLDRHDLAHVHSEPGAADRFDEQLARVELAPTVRPLTTADPQLVSRVRWLRQQQRREARRSQRRLSALEKRVRAVERSGWGSARQESGPAPTPRRRPHRVLRALARRRRRRAGA